ncbi:MAG: UDP-N-acetylmuramate--L-alanine ligase, partial [Candidatus Hydrogenedentes bacterium]|nr:UDP-N-acetylmuramate--L-alanine ligase [Candidatus Hydrogenedentota bacterium]
YLVAEADEHDLSFLRLRPTISVVTNIDAEHLENYGTLDKIKRAFTDFCNGIPFYGYSIVCWDDPNVRAILDDIDSVCITYGTEDGASLVGGNVRVGEAAARTAVAPGAPGESRPGADLLGRLATSVDVTSHDERLNVTGPLGTLTFNAVGVHNVRNALGACAVGLCLGMSFPQIAAGLRLYDGVRRRLQLRGRHNGITVVEDYAHHPTEIASTLEAARWLDVKRIVCVFQPHLYSRTKYFYDDFARVLATADRAIVTAIYPAREDPMPGVDSGLIVDAAHETGAGHVELVNDMESVPALLAPALEPGDLVLVLGAGNINRIVEPLLSELQKIC